MGPEQSRRTSTTRWPDVCWAATRCISKPCTGRCKIAALAETYHRPFAPHDCVGPVGFIAGIHASFSQPNTLIQESVRAFYTGWYKELVTTMPVIRDGYVLPMEGPGLGTELLSAVFERPDLIVRRSEG
jgi:galactonate dehydratase